VSQGEIKAITINITRSCKELENLPAKAKNQSDQKKSYCVLEKELSSVDQLGSGLLMKKVVS
jgi:hypothetical protein